VIKRFSIAAGGNAVKRSDFYIRLTTAVLFLAVIAYIGVNIYNAAINTYVTTAAMNFSIEETLSARGYIVRTETVIPETGDAVLPIVNEGEKVASGQAVAVEYMNRGALEIAGELRSLRMRIAKLESPKTIAETARLESVLALSSAVNAGDLSSLEELALNIETCFFTGGDAAASELPALKARLVTLEHRSGGMRTIYAHVSGVFSNTVDGFEHIEPRSISGISPDALEELFSSGSGIPGAGKLVTEFTWYYAAIMDANEAALLSSGRQIDVRFSGTYNTTVQMRVESVGRRDGARCVVVFSSDRRVHDVAYLRGLNAQIVYAVIDGIRVPKEAIHLGDDGSTFIYLQTGVRAERVNVEILREYGDNYLVRDGVESGTPLRAGATIIVKANNLFDGKIVA